MFEEIFFPRTAEMYRAAPLAEPRRAISSPSQGTRHLAKHLAQMRQRSAQPCSASKSAGRRPDQHSSDRGGGDDLVAAERAQMQSGCHLPRPQTVHQPRHQLAALSWAGSMNPKKTIIRIRPRSRIFEDWLRKERGLSEATVQSYCAAADHFFFWLAGKGTPLDAVQMADIDDAVAAEHKRGAWNRRTIHDYAQRLRAFFLFAEAGAAGAGRGWPQASWRLGSWRTRPCRRASGAKMSCVCWLPFRGIARSTSAIARSSCCSSLTGYGPGKSPGCGSTIWTGRTRSFAFAARSRAGPMSGHSRRRSAMPFCATYGKPVRRSRAQPLLHIARAHPTGRQKDPRQDRP